MLARERAENVPITELVILMGGNAQRAYTKVTEEEAPGGTPPSPLSSETLGSTPMNFAPNTLVSLTELTRRFRVLDTDLDTWCKEGILPEPLWINSRRYWQSDQLNQLIRGCAIGTANPDQQGISVADPYKVTVAIVCVFTALYLM